MSTIEADPLKDANRQRTDLFRRAIACRLAALAARDAYASDPDGAMAALQQANQDRVAAQTTFLETKPAPEGVLSDVARFPIGGLVEATRITGDNGLEVDYRVALHETRNYYLRVGEVIVDLRSLIDEDFTVARQGVTYPIMAGTRVLEF